LAEFDQSFCGGLRQERGAFGIPIHPAESSETVRGDAPQWQAENDESKESSTNEVFAERNNMTANARTRDLPAHHP
jgi:hypothetical protein